MRCLLDSDEVADWLRGRADAVQIVSTLRDHGLAISLITYGEMYEGVYGSRDPRASEQVFAQFVWEDATPIIAELTANVGAATTVKVTIIGRPT